MNPSAVYTNQATNTEKTFCVDNVKIEELTSNGITTGPSPYLLESTNGTYNDTDQPSPLNLNTSMGILRGLVTKLQDDINVYLTERIKSSGADDIVIDDGDDEEDKSSEV